jgi:hypothetical protein
MVICPCSEALCRASARHLMTIEVLDIDTCSQHDDGFSSVHGTPRSCSGDGQVEALQQSNGSASCSCLGMRSYCALRGLTAVPTPQ